MKTNKYFYRFKIRTFSHIGYLEATPSSLRISHHIRKQINNFSGSQFSHVCLRGKEAAHRAATARVSFQSQTPCYRHRIGYPNVHNMLNISETICGMILKITNSKKLSQILQIIVTYNAYNVETR